MRRRREMIRKIENVAHRCRTKGINRLGIVAHHRQTFAVRLESKKDRSLQTVRVLILVDQHMVETRGNIVRNLFHLHHLRPVKQQIVVIEDIMALLGLDVGAEQGFEFILPVDAPREIVLENLIKPASALTTRE